MRTHESRNSGYLLLRIQFCWCSCVLRWRRDGIGLFSNWCMLHPLIRRREWLHAHNVCSEHILGVHIEPNTLGALNPSQLGICFEVKKILCVLCRLKPHWIGVLEFSLYLKALVVRIDVDSETA